MSFLDRLAQRHREKILAAGTRQELARGQYLIRRGEPGGDVYLLEAGTFEVVDTRQHPEVVLAVLQTGAVVGEMAYIDYRPRSADVRAQSEATVRCWSRDDIDHLVYDDAHFSAAFFRAMANEASQRIRMLTEGAVAGQRAAADKAQTADAVEEARALTDSLKTGFPGLETRLRQDPRDSKAARKLIHLLDELEKNIAEYFDAYRAEAATAGAEVLHRELHAFFVRSSLAERCIRRAQGVGRSAQILAHLLVDTAGGDGRVGELLDRWLLDRPTFAALRAQRKPLIQQTIKLLPTVGTRRVLVINAGTGSLIARLIKALGEGESTVTVIDGSKDALAFIEAGMIDTPKGVMVQPIQENIPKLCMNRGDHEPLPQHVIIIHGLLEYLPDRLAVSLLRVCYEWLAPGGALIATALCDSPDAALLDRVLEWPTIRRNFDQMRKLFEAGGWEIESNDHRLAKPGILVISRRNDKTMVRRIPGR